MSDEKEPGNESATAAPNTSEQIEVPKERTAGTWEMPQPVFQQTSGYLPQGFEKRFPAHDPQEEVPTEEPVAESPVVPSPMPGQAGGAAPALDVEISVDPDVQPQPDVTEQFTLAEAAKTPAPVKKGRSRAVSVILTVLGALAMIAFAVIFLAVIYYLFFYHPNDPQILN